MSFSSKSIYVGDGVQTAFTITFPFISLTHINVFVNQVFQLNPLNYTISNSQIVFSSAPDENDAVEIKRSTSPNDLLVDFQDGSVLNESDLDMQYQHNFYLLQETVDDFNELINNTLLRIAAGAGIIETETDEIIAALVNEMLNTTGASTIQQRVSDINANAEAILTLTDDFQIQLNTLAQGVAAIVYIQDDEPIPGQGGIPDPIVDGARWYDSNDNNKPYIYDQAGTVWISLDDPRIGQAAVDILVLNVNVEQNFAALVQENFVRATEHFALASSLRVLGVANADKTAFIVDFDAVRIDTDDGITLAARFTNLSATDSTNAADITTEQTARIDQDNAIASTFTLLGAENGGGTAFILNEDTVKIASDGGDTLATRFTGLSVSTAQVATDLTTEEGARATGDDDEATARAANVATLNADISSLETAYISADGVVASTVTSLAVRVTTAEGDITQAEIDIVATVTATGVAQTRADLGVADAAVALTSGDLGQSDAATAQTAADTAQSAGDLGIANAAIANTDADTAQSAADAAQTDADTAQASNDTTESRLSAFYGVTLNVNNFITGFGQYNDGDTGSFVILADKFAIVTPSTLWASSTSYTVGQMRRPTSDNTRVFKCTTAGTSGGSEPSWDTGIGNTTNDNTVVWTTFDDVAIIPFLIDGSKITMRADVQIDGDLMVTGTINGTAMINGTIGSTQIGSDSIFSDHISSNEIITRHILAGQITAGKINVTDLSAIKADLGTITAGTIELDDAGWIKGGQSSYNVGTGYFLGFEGGGYKFSIGDPTGHRFTWDGSLLTIVGDVKVGVYIVDSTETVAEANTERTQSGLDNNVFTMKKKFTVDRDGDVRVHWQYKLVDCDHADGKYRVYKNGSQVFQVSFGNIANYLDQFFDIIGLSEGDDIEIRLSPGQTFTDVPEPGTTYIRNAQLRAIVNIPGAATVNTD